MSADERVVWVGDVVVVVMKLCRMKSSEEKKMREVLNVGAQGEDVKKPCHVRFCQNIHSNFVHM